MSPQDGPKYLDKYGLKSNDAILAEDKHMPIYEDIVANSEVTYVAGGAAQNAARAASVSRSKLQLGRSVASNVLRPPDKTHANVQ